MRQQDVTGLTTKEPDDLNMAVCADDSAVHVRILRSLHPEMSVADIAEHTGLCESTVRRVLEVVR